MSPNTAGLVLKRKEYLKHHLDWQMITVWMNNLLVQSKINSSLVMMKRGLKIWQTTKYKNLYHTKISLAFKVNRKRYVILLECQVNSWVVSWVRVLFQEVRWLQMVGCWWGPWGLKFGEELSLNGFLKANPLASHGKGLQIEPLGSEISAKNINFELLYL